MNKINVKLKNYDVLVYIDGSYNPNKNRYGAGFIVLDLQENIIHKYYEGDRDISSMRSVSGEIIAAIRAIEYCFSMGYKNILISHDYEGISKFCNKEWKTKKILSQFLKNTYKLYSKHMNIEFDLIKGHSGNKYNEMADELAKIGSGIIEGE